jgi:hypothetical protein
MSGGAEIIAEEGKGGKATMGEPGGRGYEKRNGVGETERRIWWWGRKSRRAGG